MNTSGTLGTIERHNKVWYFSLYLGKYDFKYIR